MLNRRWQGVILLALLTLVAAIRAAEEPGKSSTIKLFNRAVISKSRTQEENLRSLRGSEEAGEEDSDRPRGTVCIYQGSSCLERAQGKPGRFASCNSEVEDNICINFPTAGVVFRCASEERVMTYPAGECESSTPVEQSIACVDMTLGTYFLLCCAAKNSHGEPCAYDGAPLVLSTQDQQKQTWWGGKFVKW